MDYDIIVLFELLIFINDKNHYSYFLQNILYRKILRTAFKKNNFNSDLI